MISCLGDILQGCVLMLLLLRTDLRVRSVFQFASVCHQIGLDPREGGTAGKNLVFDMSSHDFSPDAVLCLLLGWDLVSPSFRVRAFQSGSKQGLFSTGGFLHSLSFVLSLLSFVVVSVMLGYKTVFLAPVPLILAFTVVFVAKSFDDEDFKTWSFSLKATHCLVASIFPITSPRPASQVLNLI